jgi:ABC-type transport system involved in cytochrome c biogenesis permease component
MEEAAKLDATWLYYALSTVAQCAAALAALIGFFGLWRQDRLREQIERLNVHPKDDPTHIRLPQLLGEQRCLMRMLSAFLVVTLAVILAPAIVGLVFVKELHAWAGMPWLIGAASAWLGVAPAYVVLRASRSMFWPSPC